MTNLQFLPSLYYLQDPFHHVPPAAGMHHQYTSQASYPSHLLQKTSNAFNFGRGFPFGGYHATEIPQDAEERMEDDSRTNITNLYPEILTIIFSKLDLQSKGRVARVRVSSGFFMGRI